MYIFPLTPSQYILTIGHLLVLIDGDYDFFRISIFGNIIIPNINDSNNNNTVFIEK